MDGLVKEVYATLYADDYSYAMAA